jgi:ferrous iron transport protein A
MVLTDLKPGRRAQIIDITLVNDLLRRRLTDLGVMEGAEVYVRRALPFGGPLTLEAAGQGIGIRRSDAGRIKVELA